MADVEQEDAAHHADEGVGGEYHHLACAHEAEHFVAKGGESGETAAQAHSEQKCPACLQCAEAFEQTVYDTEYKTPCKVYANGAHAEP